MTDDKRQLEAQQAEEDMTEAQRVLYEMLTPLKRQVALNSFMGMSNIEAYRNSCGKAKTQPAMSAGACEILSDPNVKAFLSLMNQSVLSEAVMTRQEMLEELTTLIRTNIDDLIDWDYRDVEVINESGKKTIQRQSFWSMKPQDQINPIHLSAIEELSVGQGGLKFKKVPKLTAMNQLAELAGYKAAQKHDLSSTDGTMTPRTMNDFYSDVKQNREGGNNDE